MRWENIGVNVKKNLWKVFPQPQNPSQACRRSLGSTTRPRQTTLENIQHIGELQILVRQGSFCLKRVQTPAHASGSPRVTLSPQREISACPQTPTAFFPYSSTIFPAVYVCPGEMLPMFSFFFLPGHSRPFKTPPTAQERDQRPWTVTMASWF